MVVCWQVCWTLIFLSSTKFGDRAFSISAPRLWNALPQHLKDSTSCQAFKKCLKTHLFRLAHWGVVDYDSNYDNVQRFWTFNEWKRRYINSNYYYYYYNTPSLEFGGLWSVLILYMNPFTLFSPSECRWWPKNLQDGDLTKTGTYKSMVIFHYL